MSNSISDTARSNLLTDLVLTEPVSLTNVDLFSQSSFYDSTSGVSAADQYWNYLESLRP